MTPDESDEGNWHDYEGNPIVLTTEQRSVKKRIDDARRRLDAISNQYGPLSYPAQEKRRAIDRIEHECVMREDDSCDQVVVEVCVICGRASPEWATR